MAYYESSAGMLVFEAAITGTHSAGKTTTLDSLRDSALTEQCGLEEPFGISLVEVPVQSYGEEQPETQLAPLLTVSEAARFYAEQRGNLALLGNEYTAQIQRHVDLMAAAHLQRGRAELARASSILRQAGHAGRLAHAGFILGDRSYLDGQVYAGIRLPGVDYENMSDVPLGSHMRFQAAASLDLVFIADATEVEFEPEAARPDDLGMRKEAQRRLIAQYAEFGANAPHLLQGDPETRRTQILATLGFMTSAPFVAQSPLTAYLAHREQF